MNFFPLGFQDRKQASIAKEKQRRQFFKKDVSSFLHEPWIVYGAHNNPHRQETVGNLIKLIP